MNFDYKKLKNFTKLFTNRKVYDIIQMFLKIIYPRQASLKIIQGGENTNVTYVGLCGKLSVDLAVYLGQILKNLQKRVLIADLTEGHGLYYLFSVSEKFPVTYRNVDYIGKDFNVYAEENNEYNYILICMENNIRHILGNYLSKIYYISDTQYINFFSMVNEIKNSRMATGIIVRDVTDGGIHAQYLMKYVFMDDYLLKMYQTHRVYQIHDDLTDREYRINMQYGDFGGFQNLSAEFLKVLEQIAAELTGYDKKQIKYSLKYAKEGKTIEKHNILEQRFGKKRNKQ